MISDNAVVRILTSKKGSRLRFPKKISVRITRKDILKAGDFTDLQNCPLAMVVRKAINLKKPDAKFRVGLNQARYGSVVYQCETTKYFGAQHYQAILAGKLKEFKMTLWKSE